jgi:hypothetical protein
LKNLIKSMLRNKAKTRVLNSRAHARINQDAIQPEYFTVKDHRGQLIQAKLVDISDQGCRLVFSNLQLFINSELRLRFSDKVFPYREQRTVKASVVWSELHKLDQSRYCEVGIKFSELCSAVESATEILSLPTSQAHGFLPTLSGPLS